jgi:DHA1 family bicyclomycin/chloramphenicol resistance-like MFS transporter
MPTKNPAISLVFLITLSLLGCSIQMDLSLPSFPSMMQYFHASELQVQNTLNANFLAICIAGLIYGPVSEAWGRRGLMLFGATCFLLGSIGCVLSESIYQMIFSRFVQGLGASSALVLGFAMISDCFKGDEAAKHISKINSYTTIIMASAPITGSILVKYFNWRANFTAVAVLALLAWVVLVLFLPETSPKKRKLQIKNILKDYATIMMHKRFMVYALLPNMIVTAYLTFVGSGAFYYMNTCKLPVMWFAVHQGLLVCAFSFMSFNVGKVISKIGSARTMFYGMGITIVGAILFIIFAFVTPKQPALITTAMCIFAVGCALPMSIIFAESLEVIPELKGVCSSFIMSTRLFLSSVGVAFTGYYFDGTMKPVAEVIFVSILIATLSYLVILKLKQEKQIEVNACN